MILYPEFSGRITKIYVNEGDRVNKGQALAKIDDGGLYNELKLVESQTKLAKTIYERQSKLWEDKIGSEIQYLEAQTNYDIQKNRLESLKQSLAKTTITAPFSGTIDEIFIEEGNLVSPPMMPDQGNTFRIVNLNKLYVEAVIPESFIGKIQKGAEVLVDIPVLSKSFKSKIKHSVSSINQLSRTFKIEVSVPKNNLDLIPNLNVEINILDYTNSEAILVPESIVSEDSENNKFLYTIENNKAKKTIVETGYTQNGMIEITSGLNLNQTVINEGGRIVKDGQNVKIYNDNE
jgi:RND family efflux transporter MFP subunit